MQVGALFGLIFAIIVMAFILLVGTNQLEGILCLGNVGQTNKVLTELDKLTDHMQASGLGSRETFRMRTPENAVVCFVDPADPSPNFLGGWNPDPELYIEEEIMSEGYNLWVEYNCGVNKAGHNIDYLVPEENFCAESGDMLLLTNIGMDVSVEIYTG